jgi:hypothetical protein
MRAEGPLAAGELPEALISESCGASKIDFLTEDC